MTDGISSINNSTVNDTVSTSSSRVLPNNGQNSKGSLLNFDIEDKAIISSEAKILNELDKYNSGQSDEVSLALTTVTNKHQIEAEINVINSKNEMLKKIMQLGE